VRRGRGREERGREGGRESLGEREERERERKREREILHEDKKAEYSPA
jgi:hypothetical protein